MRFLGIDPGRRRIGLALSDDAGGTMALPLDVVERAGNDEAAAKAVAAAVAGETLAGVVVGLPLRLNGSEGTAARRVRRFGAALEAALSVPLHYWDERMSTVAAERSLGRLGVKGRARRAQVDSAAAALILQGFLDARVRAGADGEG
ncbi:MAG: Holliday junction resolvase RuvX [Myxococcota bacterium]